ncbi:uncharacterized protein LOC141885084 [Acropora palmata]|uniref:uncharacterized protein LOC141885084 n=1 Tax=Acropora palmata TaxID=6131 RepID=UPI003D9FE441
MSPERFNHLLILVGPLIAKKPCRSRNTFTEAERLMVTLRYLATGEAQQTQALCFRLGKATVSRIVRETCKALGEALNETYVKTPSTSDDWKNIAQEFDEITSWKAHAYRIFTRVDEVSEIERVSAANE